jgi:hypothetical protein
MTTKALIVAVDVAGAPLWLMARSQQASADTVPKEIVAILMRGAPLQGFDLRVGGPPADFPKDLLPAGTEVAVSAVSDRGTTIVGIASGLSATDRARLDQALSAAGWISAGPRVRGFTMNTADMPTSICRGSDFASVALIPRPEGGSYVRASNVKDPRRSCQPRPEMSFTDVNIPALPPPPNSKAYGGGGGGSLDQMYSSTRLETTFSLAALASHYTALFTAAGWQIEGRTIEEERLSVTRFSTKSTNGDPITAILTITSFRNSSLIDLAVRIVRDRGDGRIGG